MNQRESVVRVGATEAHGVSTKASPMEKAPIQSKPMTKTYLAFQTAIPSQASVVAFGSIRGPHSAYCQPPDRRTASWQQRPEHTKR